MPRPSPPPARAFSRPTRALAPSANGCACCSAPPVPSCPAPALLQVQPGHVGNACPTIRYQPLRPCPACLPTAAGEHWLPQRGGQPPRAARDALHLPRHRELQQRRGGCCCCRGLWACEKRYGKAQLAGFSVMHLRAGTFLRGPPLPPSATHIPLSPPAPTVRSADSVRGDSVPERQRRHALCEAAAEQGPHPRHQGEPRGRAGCGALASC